MSQEGATEEGFAAEIIRGLLYTHHRANTNTAEVHQARAALEALIQVLVEQGVVDRETLETYRQQVADRLREEYVGRRMTVAIHNHEGSKYAHESGVEIDCASRIHLCKAACCRLQFALTKEDVEEGIMRWELSQPYMNAKRADGYCVHLEDGTCRCTVHAHRPVICRSYDCRQDARIWVDFDKQLVNPRLNDSDWPRSTKPDAASMIPEAGTSSPE